MSRKEQGGAAGGTNAFECLYKCGSASASTQEYHVLPFSASWPKFSLGPGFVCDKCNSYFGRQLEQHFVERHPGAWARLLRLPETRKGKAPRFNYKVGTATRIDREGMSTLKFPLDDMRHEVQENGDILLTGTVTPPPFDSVMISRALAKMALESLFLYSGDGVLDPRRAEFDDLRAYARFGCRKWDYVWFAWRKTNEPQVPPVPINVQDPGKPPVARLCRISFPEFQ